MVWNNKADPWIRSIFDHFTQKQRGVMPSLLGAGLNIAPPTPLKKHCKKRKVEHDHISQFLLSAAAEKSKQATCSAVSRSCSCRKAAAHPARGDI